MKLRAVFSVFLHKDFMPYVVALYRQAVEENKLKPITLAATAICDLLNEHHEILAFLNIAFIPYSEKIEVLERALPEKTPELFSTFLKLLGQNHKLNSLRPILSKFLEYADHKSNIHHIKIISAFALDASTQKKLKKALEAQLNTSVELIISIDASLIGGIIIHYHKHELDLSIKHSLFSLKSTLKELYT